MTDGEILKQFLDNHNVPKSAIARDLRMSKQNLFQFFKSKTLELDTKNKFENYFRKSIFSENNVTSKTVEAKSIKQPDQDYREKYIALLESQVQRNDQILDALMEIKELLKSR